MTFFLVDTEEEPMIYFGGGGPDSVQFIVGANGILHPSATFTRASAGTTEITQGVFSQAAVNEPRYQWVSGKRGLLIEPAATNLLFPSVVAATMSAAVTSRAYTLSFFGTGSVTLSGASTGVVTGTGATLKEFTFTPTAGTLTLTVSGSVTQWQLESGTKATSRIVTTSAAATRAPDFPAITTSAFEFNPNEGTFVCEFLAKSAGSPFEIDGGAGNKRLGIAPDYPSSGQLSAFAITPSGTLFSTVSGYTAGQLTKVAISYSINSLSISANGGSAMVQSGVFDLPLWANRLSIGLNSVSLSNFINGVDLILPYYPRKYSAAELQAAST